MKTPRQILFEKHQAITPKLDQIRKQAITPAPSRSEKISIPWKLWLELIWPARRVWLGMAGVWVVVAVLSFSTPEESVVMANSAPISQKTMAGLQEQNRLMTQLLRADEGDVPDAEEPARNKTRSEVRLAQIVG